MTTNPISWSFSHISNSAAKAIRQSRYAEFKLATCAASLVLLACSGATVLAQGGPATLALPAVDGTNVTIRWNTGGTLQLAPDVMGPWISATGGVTTTSSFSQPVARGSRFFRVVDQGVAGEPVPIFPASPEDPLEVERAVLRRLSQPSPDGDALLEVLFGQGQEVKGTLVPLLVEDRLIILRDDGRGGDRVSGDHLFSAIVDDEIEELEGMNRRIAELSPEQRQQPDFQSRQIVGTNRIDFLNLSNFNAGQPLLVHPFPFGAADLRENNTAGGLAPAPIPPLPPSAFKTLMITDLSVVQDPLRTWDPCAPAAGTPMGAWTFGRLMTDMANTPVTGISAQDFVRRWLRSWQFPQTINSDVVPDRNLAIRAQIIDAWEIASGGPGAPLDLAKAPFRLLAIVNRVDLRANLSYGASPANPCDPPCLGGEGRFVFCATDPGGCFGLPVLVILEYCVPKRTCHELRSWAKQWRALAAIPFGPAYNAALEAITDQFATANADPSRLPNKSAINQVRSNELLDAPWDMREWRIFATDSDAGHLRQVTVKQTPDFDLNFSPLLASYVNTPANIPLILADKHTVPLTFSGQPFLGGSAPMPSPFFFWDGPPPVGTSIPTPNLRHKFSLNTCNGCHAGETSTFFTHVGQAPFGVSAPLSGFLTGILAPDPAVGAPARPFSDLARRAIDLDHLAHTPCFFHLFFKPLRMKH